MNNDENSFSRSRNRAATCSTSAKSYEMTPYIASTGWWPESVNVRIFNGETNREIPHEFISRRLCSEIENFSERIFAYSAKCFFLLKIPLCEYFRFVSIAFSLTTLRIIYRWKPTYSLVNGAIQYWRDVRSELITE